MLAAASVCSVRLHRQPIGFPASPSLQTSSSPTPAPRISIVRCSRNERGREGESFPTVAAALGTYFVGGNDRGAVAAVVTVHENALRPGEARRHAKVQRLAGAQMPRRVEAHSGRTGMFTPRLKRVRFHSLQPFQMPAVAIISQTEPAEACFYNVCLRNGLSGSLAWTLGISDL